MKKFLIPIGLFVALGLLLAVGLKLDPRKIPSPLVGKPLPAFSLATLEDPQKTLTETDFRGQVVLFNVWASWCVACKQEHPVLLDLAGRKLVPIVGLNYKDPRDAALAVLKADGNPYEVSLVDADGRVGIDWGVYGVPETFVVDKLGIIRHKHIGPITPEVIEQELLPLIRSLS
ncbi:MAG: thiol:disulfide interchange protein [Candidatus Muproteobacteria bacterium RBG_16_64_11]|uniref:Thiol:disulfide interchange protein n=1 Tax=Candidatus Muproteobacteria bacterium RBG_16_64_11 TaxID=1817758 RepID=A0A1F6T908_9PROT|nr:MAG: thiol:disulfide interchange protein [Candidatus Muproteobacteria bacterium RBG_16_64_11]